MRSRLAALLSFVLLMSPVLLAHAQDADPNLWLEDVEGKKALAWVKER